MFQISRFFVFMCPLSDPDALTGVILAGGKARRMGGQDKGLLPYRGYPLVEHVIERLNNQTSALIINANRNQEQYERFGYPVIADSRPDFLGPLSGMLAGLEAAHTSRVLFAPCDSPHISSDLASRLAEPFATGPNVLMSVASCEGRLQPVFAMLSVTQADDLNAFLEEGGRKIDEFYATQGYAEVIFSDCNTFANINTLEELQC